ncbi:hypothetical protein Zmor_021450 [Zophobas morio]|uniref:Uncharacterized protein n=2 Tax=Zophobas morio TaxID=2755281 RepID=A0AA38I5M0_9CUCU|nr:hypothetical protein Zmor_021450 [Zophobas morio]
MITVFATVFLLSSSLALPVEEPSPIQKNEPEPVAATQASDNPPESQPLENKEPVIQESPPSLGGLSPEDVPVRLGPVLEGGDAPVPQALPGGDAAVPQAVANPEEKSDLDTANTFWGGYYGYRPYWGGYGGGWRRGYGGWGGYGGYGGYGRGFGGYGGWGWGGGWGGRRYYWG